MKIELNKQFDITMNGVEISLIAERYVEDIADDIEDIMPDVDITGDWGRQSGYFFKLISCSDENHVVNEPDTYFGNESEIIGSIIEKYY